MSKDTKTAVLVAAAAFAAWYLFRQGGPASPTASSAQPESLTGTGGLGGAFQVNPLVNDPFLAAPRFQTPPFSAVVRQ